MRPTKPLLRSLYVDGKIEKNKKEFPVSNEEFIAGKSSNAMGKINDIDTT